MKTSGAVLLGSLLLLQGCAGLIIREQDSAEMIAGKVLTRVVAGVTTAGMSEVGIATIKQREELDNSQRQVQLRQRNYFDGLVGRLTYSEALMKWGPPAQSQTHGAMVVAVWQRYRPSPGYLHLPSIPGNPYSSAWSVALPDSGSRLQLVFDRETEMLRSWSTQDW